MRWMTSLSILGSVTEYDYMKIIVDAIASAMAPLIQDLPLNARKTATPSALSRCHQFVIPSASARWLIHDPGRWGRLLHILRMSRPSSCLHIGQP